LKWVEKKNFPSPTSNEGIFFHRGVKVPKTTAEAQSRSKKRKNTSKTVRFYAGSSPKVGKLTSPSSRNAANEGEIAGNELLSLQQVTTSPCKEEKRSQRKMSLNQLPRVRRGIKTIRLSSERGKLKPSNPTCTEDMFLK